VPTGVPRVRGAANVCSKPKTKNKNKNKNKNKTKNKKKKKKKKKNKNKNKNKKIAQESVREWANRNWNNYPLVNTLLRLRFGNKSED
jgi:hypothetical protein